MAGTLALLACAFSSFLILSVLFDRSHLLPNTIAIKVVTVPGGLFD